MSKFGRNRDARVQARRLSCAGASGRWRWGTVHTPVAAGRRRLRRNFEVRRLEAGEVEIGEVLLEEGRRFLVAPEFRDFPLHNVAFLSRSLAFRVATRARRSVEARGPGLLTGRTTGRGAARGRFAPAPACGGMVSRLPAASGLSRRPSYPLPPPSVSQASLAHDGFDPIRCNSCSRNGRSGTISRSREPYDAAPHSQC